MPAYQLSTPQYTCLVIMNRQGQIMATAPYLWRWRGRLWVTLLAEARRRFGDDAVRWTRLDQEEMWIRSRAYSEHQCP